MRNFLKKDGLKILIAFVLITTGVAILNFTWIAPKISAGINYITAPLKKVSGAIFGIAERSIERKKTAEEYENEIAQLKTENTKLKSQLIDYYETKRENAQYLKFYDFKKQNPGLKFISGKVLEKDNNDLFKGFTLDQGTINGVKINDPIVTDKGLIGRVCEVFDSSCVVKTILSPEVKAGVLDVKTGDNGVLMGNIRLADQNLTGMMYLPSQNTIEIGDTVVTSGLGGTYPKSLPVGIVKELSYDDYDSSLFAKIEPLADIKNAVEVFIITDFAERK
ncbi:MAG: rod shape-determining protein MreC [Clostridia bacterium]|nr:rod shape-determining protein MreC [Clostridia bacterium]